MQRFMTIRPRPFFMQKRKVEEKTMKKIILRMLLVATTLRGQASLLR